MGCGWGGVYRLGQWGPNKNVKERRGQYNLRAPRGSSFLRLLSARGLSDWPKRLCDKVGRLKKPTEGRTPRNQTSSESASGLEGGREGGVAFFQN